MTARIWTPGAEIAPLEAGATEVDLFRFSAVTWNAHRIHYDRARAQAEGLSDLVVQAHLQGAWFARLARSIAGPSARLREVSWSNKAPVLAGEQVVLSGSVDDVEQTPAASMVSLMMTERGRDGTLRADASARVEIPDGVRR